MTDPARRSPLFPPLEEVERLHRETKWPVAEPLSAEELGDLRARLNAPGGSHIELSYSEFEARKKMGVIRPPDMVADLVQEVVSVGAGRAGETNREYLDGILAAVAWAIGDVRAAPVTGSIPEGEQPSTFEMTEEMSAGRACGEGRLATSCTRPFGTGVEATLMWLMARCDDPPL